MTSGRNAPSIDSGLSDVWTIDGPYYVPPDDVDAEKKRIEALAGQGVDIKITPSPRDKPYNDALQAARKAGEDEEERRLRSGYGKASTLLTRVGGPYDETNSFLGSLKRLLGV